MKHIPLALILLALAVPQAETPATTYPVHFVASFEGMGAIGAVPSDLEIVMASSTYTRTLNNLLAGPSFTVQVAEPPPYEWRLKGWQHLASGGTSETGEIDAEVQRVGDIGEVVSEGAGWRIVTGDNRVDTLDFSRFRTWFGQPRPCCTPDITRFALSDLNGDNDVDVIDFNLLLANYGQAGYGE